MRKLVWAVAAALVVCAPLGALGQDTDELIAAGEDEADVLPAAMDTSAAIEPAGASDLRVAEEAPVASVTVPALTEVMIEILAELGSRTSKQGDTFPLRLAAPIVIDGVELIPAGTPGFGEVIHAKKSGGSGAAGELVLAARYLEVGDARLPLRSLRFDASARDRMRTVETINLASAAVMPVASFVGFFIKGDQLSLASGSVLSAKTAADFPVEVAASNETSSSEPPIEATAETADVDSATGEER